MTEGMPLWTRDGCTTAQEDRSLITSMVETEGATSPTDLALTPGVGMNITVSAGGGFVAGDDGAAQGMYHVPNDGDVNVAIAAADPTDGRIDLIIARVYDAEYAGALTEWKLEAVTGTPSPVPVAPAAPNGSIILGSLTVAAGATSFIAGNISSATRQQAKFRTEMTSAAGLREILTYTASTTFTKATYPWLKAVRVRCVGGGGGGGCCEDAGASVAAVGGNGGGGGYAEGLIAADDLAASETITIGANGNGGVQVFGVPTAGGAGTTTSFGAFVQGGGGNGGAAGFAAVNTISAGGAGGSTAGTHVDVSVRGQSGDVGRVVGGEPVPGRGGDSLFGYGGGQPAATNAGAGVTGTGHGSGGSGCLVRESNSVPGDAGDGTDGYMIVELYG